MVSNASVNAKINEVKIKILNITNLATNASLNAKINEVKGKIPNTNNLATTSTLIAVENEIHNVSNLVKEIYYRTRIRGTENKIITDHDLDKNTTTQIFIKLTSKNYTGSLKLTTLAIKNDIAKFVIKTNFDEKLKTINSNKK